MSVASLHNDTTTISHCRIATMHVMCSIASLHNDTTTTLHVKEEMFVGGVKIGNKVQINDYPGTLFTDGGSWTPRTAEVIHKHHGLCTKHKSTGIVTSMAGLGGLQSHYMKDMNALIYNVFPSDEAFELAIEAALNKFGHNSAARKFIESVQDERKKLCATFMQHILSHGHTTTQRSEGFNGVLKGHGDLKSYLAVASLKTLIDRIDKLSRDQDYKAIHLLKKLREEDRRWSDYYESQLDEHTKLVAAEVFDCVPASADNEHLFNVTRTTNGVTRVNLVNLKTPVVHHGVVYEIPTCRQCGDWNTHFITCPCIIRSLALAGRPVKCVYIIHPLHLVQNHVMWQHACNELNLPDYDDFEQVSSKAGEAVAKEGEVPAGLGVAVAGRGEAAASVAETVANSSTRPANYWNRYDLMPNGRIPETVPARVRAIRELCEKVVVAVSNSKEEKTFRIAHSRLLQTADECTGSEHFARPPIRMNGRKRKGDNDNLSPLNHGAGRSSKANKKNKSSASFFGTLEVKPLKSLCKAAKLGVAKLRKNQLCMQLDENETTARIGNSSAEQLVSECQQKALIVTGSKFELMKRLIHHEFGTTSEDEAPAGSAVAGAVAGPFPPAAVTPEQMAMLSQLTNLINSVQSAGGSDGSNNGGV